MPVDLLRRIMIDERSGELVPRRGDQRVNIVSQVATVAAKPRPTDSSGLPSPSPED